MGTEVNDKPEHLEEIRDIIFGPQKRDFEKRLGEIQQQIEAAKTQFALMIEELNSSFLSELRSLSGEMEETLKHAEERSNTQRLEIIQQAQQTEMRFTSAIQGAIQTSAERIATLDLMMKRAGETVDGKFREQEGRLEQQSAEVLERMKGVRNDLLQQLREVQSTLTQRDHDLVLQLRTSEERAEATRSEFLKQLGSMESRFEKSVTNAIQAAAEKIGGLDVQVNANHKKLQQEISELRSDVMQSLEKRTNDLASSKVSRESLADMLVELAKRFKADERTDLKLITQAHTSKP